MAGQRTPGARRRMSSVILGALVLSAVTAMTACGDDESPIVRPDSSATSVPAPTTAPSAAPTASQPSIPGSGPRMTVTPSTGLGSSQVVKVTGAGFSPNQSLVVTQCADKGTQTGPADCNLAGLTAVTSDASGVVNTDFTVLKGPFGGNQIDCGQQRCLVSISQATPSPTEQADVAITFS